MAPRQLADYELETHELARQIIPEDVRTVADIGCGSGAFTNTIVDRYQVTGIDFNEIALQSVKCDTIAAPITDIPAEDGRFDLAMAMQVLEHLPYDGTMDTGVAELARVARRYVMITVPAHDDPVLNAVRCPVCKSRFHRAQHIRFFQPSTFTDLIPGFKLIKLVGAGKRYQGSPLLVNLAMAGSRYTGASIPGCPCLICGATVEMAPIRASLWSTFFMGLDLLLVRLKRLFGLSVPYNYIALFEREKTQEASR